MLMENQLYDQRVFSTFPSLEGLLGLNKNYKKQRYLPLRFTLSVPCLIACLLLYVFAFPPFQGDLIRFFCALTKFEMQRAPSLRKTRVRLSARARHLGTHALLMERYKNQVKSGGRLAPKPPCTLHALSKSTGAKPIPTDQSLIWLLLLLLSY